MNSCERVIRAIEFGAPDRNPLISWRTEHFEHWLCYVDHITCTLVDHITRLRLDHFERLLTDTP